MVSRNIKIEAAHEKKIPSINFDRLIDWGVAFDACVRVIGKRNAMVESSRVELSRVGVHVCMGSIKSEEIRDAETANATKQEPGW